MMFFFRGRVTNIWFFQMQNHFAISHSKTFFRIGVSFLTEKIEIFCIQGALKLRLQELATPTSVNFALPTKTAQILTYADWICKFEFFDSYKSNYVFFKIVVNPPLFCQVNPAIFIVECRLRRYFAGSTPLTPLFFLFNSVKAAFFQPNKSVSS